ncbi:hypothetical protein BKK81_23575 [Cupriavidus sp. USMAHM13]|uniref:phage tail protein n=1 Tax=Cupriavidus sp. USMAHM13 TaxID=1389192 RepID=UPI0008A66720|nr:phage tail protein [Cupriavidus sp. USMAHM13]AOZ02266.1 hypothetical protein BKK81_23575 [Cupriavidus sp. USMAHM13]
MGAVFKPRIPNSFTSEAQGRTQIVRSNVQPRNLVYGRAMTSGPLVFAASTHGDGRANQFMHLVVALADHECEDIEEIYLGEDAVGRLDAKGFPVGGRFLKEWNESKTVEWPVKAGQRSVTIEAGEEVRNIISLVALLPVEGEDSRAATRSVPVKGIVVAGNASQVRIDDFPEDTRAFALTFDGRRTKAYVKVRSHLGSSDQGADDDLVSEVPGWTREHRLRGVCYLYVRLEYDADLFPNGLPNIKALVRGKRVYDPRNGTTTWSDNWALCVYDYLRDARGFACGDGDVDAATVRAAANVSDELVPLGNDRSESRYRCNGVVMLDKSPRDNLTEMTTAGAGAVVISGGVFRVFAGAYDIPTVTLSEDDLRGQVKVQPRMSRRDLFNAVKGTFINPSGNWQPGDFPPQRNALYAQQDGEVIERDIELPFTIDTVTAQRLAKIILERSRQGIVVEFPAKLSAFQLSAYSTVKLNLAKFGWQDKVFRVMSWKMSDDGGVDLVLNEEAAAVYDWNHGDATTSDPAPDTNLPNPFRVETVGQIRMDSGEEQLILSQSGVVISRVLVSWPPAQDVTLRQRGRIELEFKLLEETSWTALPALPAGATSTYLAPVEDLAYYMVRARYVSAIGVRSPDWTYSPAHRVIGKSAPPHDVSGLSLAVLNGFANLSWDASVDLDVRNGGQARIRHTTDLQQPSWNSAVDIGGYTAGSANAAQLPLLEGAYLAKWIDSSGNESLHAAQVTTTAPSLLDLNVVATVAEQPQFAGSKQGIVYDAALGGIKLVGRALIDEQGPVDASGLWDSQPRVDGIGPVDTVVGNGGWGLVDSLGGIVEHGSYAFAGALDLGVVESSRLTAAIDTVSFDTGDLFDFRLERIDGWQSIDGDRISDTAVALYVRTTADDPGGSPAWSPWQRFAVGDYEARAFQWKAELASASPTHNVLVRGLAVSVDMPDRRDYARDVVAPAAPYAIAFARPFRIVPSLGVTAQDMAQGDFFTVAGKSRSGFTIRFFNSAGAPVSRRFDWDAVGY